MLSLAGRQVLIQASSATIPAYVMQCSYLPGRILDGIDRVNRNFLWGSSESLKKIHWIGWHKVTKLKEEGGLGLQTAKGRNLALLAKLNWRFHTEGDVPWVQVLRKKYCSGRRLNATNPTSLPCSSIWAAMKKGMGIFDKGSRWSVGRESKLNLWYSCWLNKGPLRSLIQGPLSREANKLEVKDFMKDTGWDWNGLSVELPLDIQMLIKATPIAMTSRGCDKITWADSPQGTFNLKSAYRIAMGHEEVPKFSASWLWKANTLPRIKTFIWMCAHNSIGVRSCLMRRGVCAEAMCPICQEAEESILHALRDCPWAKAVWNRLGRLEVDQVFWNSELLDWLSRNGNKRSTSVTLKPPWEILFLFTVWNIWKSRNNFVFQRKRLNQQLHMEVLKQSYEFLHCIASPRVMTQRCVKRIRWEKPPDGWMKLNTDGSVIGSKGVAGCGGVIRDDGGNWISGFTKRIGITNSFMAEMWGLREGLIMCCNLNIAFLIVELDARTVVDVFSNAQYVNNVISPILDDCRLLSTRFSQIQFHHCYHEGNRVADMLARMSHNQEADCIAFSSPPVDVLNAFENDCNGGYVNRLCPAPLVFS